MIRSIREITETEIGRQDSSSYNDELISLFLQCVNNHDNTAEEKLEKYERMISVVQKLLNPFI